MSRYNNSRHATALIVLLLIGMWVVNLVKLTDCDFEPNYRCEVLHGIGIALPLAVVTVWFDTDKP